MELHDPPGWCLALSVGDLDRDLAPVNKVVDGHNNPDPACVDCWNYLGCLPLASSLQSTTGIVLVYTSFSVHQF